MTTYTTSTTRAGQWVLAVLGALTIIALALSMTPIATNAQTTPNPPTLPTPPTPPGSPADVGGGPTLPTDPTCPTQPTLPGQPIATSTVDCGANGGGDGDNGGGGTTTPAFVQVHILKYIQGASSTQPYSTATSSFMFFPMTAIWTASNLNNGSTTSGTFSLGFGQVDTSALASGASYMASEVNSSNASSTDSVIGSGQACVAGHYRTVGYRMGDSLAGATAATLTTSAPQFTNLTSDKYLLVVNEYCITDGMPSTGGGGGDTGGGTGTTTPSNSTIVVRYADLSHDLAGAGNRWFFWNGGTGSVDTTIGDGAFVNGPGTAPLGAGSVGLQASTSDSHGIATTQFDGVRLADVSGLSYSTYVDGTGTTTSSAPYLDFDVDLTGTGSGNGQLLYLPEHNGTVATGTWQTWNTTGAGQWTWTGYASSTSTSTPNEWPDLNTNQYRSWQSIVTAFPNSRIAPTNGLLGVNLAGTALASTSASTSPATISGFLDDLSLSVGSTTTTGTTTTFDFEPTVNNGGGSGGGGGGGGGGGSSHSSSGGDIFGVGGGGEVLGAACPLITSWMRAGQYNDPNQVNLLQSFLNGELGDNLNVSGIIDDATTGAINAFQVKYWQDVLEPWVPYGLASDHTPTGYVYKTTSYKINTIACPDMTFNSPVLP